MDKTKKFYCDKITGVYGQAEHLIIANMSAAEIHYVGNMTDDKRIKYFGAIGGPLEVARPNELDQDIRSSSRESLEERGQTSTSSSTVEQDVSE